MPRTGTSALRAPRDQPTLTDLMKLAIRNTKLGVRTALPAKVVIYDAVKQVATIQPELVSVMNTEQGIQTQLPIQLVEIPVAWSRTNLGFLTFPLLPGDTGMLIVSDRSIDKWTTQGVTTDPGFNHTHNLIDGVFYPGLKPDTTPIIPSTSLTHTVLEGPLISIGTIAGNPATEPLVKGTAYTAALTTYTTTVNTANLALSLAAGVYYAIPPLPGIPDAAARGVFAAAYVTWNTTITTAQGVLATQLAAALSVKGFVV